ncbi:NAD-dependent succinate-semialdehyde dehydrogenase [Thalassobius sp. Cn5-15]|uniref:NAD-dependent succinate-semialdehyde dehydrogenase n=1 Tax=Thalassobius sp. Cn5-15 TaxID=2917763 RepID=UPI00351CCA6B
MNIATEFKDATVGAALDKAFALDLLKTGSFIDGAWIEHADDPTFPVVDPASREVLCQVADHGAAEAQAAIDAADKALADWKATTPRARAALMEAWCALVEQHKEVLAQILTLENGKPLAESLAEIGYGNSYIKWYAEEAKRIEGAILPSLVPDAQAIVTREPVGVVAAVTPWNFPSAMLARKVAPALAAGCTIVVKPSDETPLSALALTELASRAGIPAGVINVVVGKDAPAIGGVFTGSEVVRKISFTGSTAVGKLLLEQCARTVKKASMELGGNAPFIVFDDADMDKAIDGLMVCKYRNAGQVCTATNRVLVQRGIYDRFAAAFAKRAAALQHGHGLQGCDLGPLINDASLTKVQTLVDSAMADGASVVCGGKRAEDAPYHYLPTVMTGITTNMQIAGTEVFGPVAALIPFESEDEAVEIANSTEYGLASYFYTTDTARMWRVRGALEFGMVGVNTCALGNEIAPFGGVKESGIGREGGREGIEEYLESKYALMAP